MNTVGIVAASRQSGGDPGDTGIPVGLILLFDGVGSVPAGWNAYNSFTDGAFLAAGSSRDSGGSATRTLEASGTHSSHTVADEHTHNLKAYHPFYAEELVNIGDAGGVTAANHEHSAGTTEGGVDGSVDTAATTEITADNNPRHFQLKPYINVSAITCEGMIALTTHGFVVDWDERAWSDFLKLVSTITLDPDEDGPEGAESPSYTILPHHETHGDYTHNHSTIGSLTIEEVDPGDVAINSSGSNARTTPTSHSHSGSLDSVTPAAADLTDTVLDSQGNIPTFAAQFDTFLVRLIKAVADAIPMDGVIGLWDEGNGAVPDGWEEISITATNNSPLVKVDASSGETPRVSSPETVEITHGHAVADHSHSITGTLAEDNGSSTEGGGDDIGGVNDYHDGVIEMTTMNSGRIKQLETTFVLADGDTMPLYEQFKLIRRVEE